MLSEAEAVGRVRAWLREQERTIDTRQRVVVGDFLLPEVTRTQKAGARLVFTDLRRWLYEWDEAIKLEAGLESKQSDFAHRLNSPRKRTVRIIRKAQPVPGAPGQSVGIA